MIGAKETSNASIGVIRTGNVRKGFVEQGSTARQVRPLPVSVRMVFSIVLVASVLTFLPDRTRIAPMIESDYAYQLLAVDRFVAGNGLTSLQPIAPGQPWDFQYEWGYLTKWPVGYSLLIAMVRGWFDCSTIQACQAIGIVACALALVGWFVWARRMVPKGWGGVLLSLAATGAGVTVSYLINPSTDLLLAAAMPYILLLTHRALSINNTTLKRHKSMSVVWLTLAGLLCGSLFWIRYASIFIPAGVGGFLLWMWLRTRVANQEALPHVEKERVKVHFRHVAVFGICAILPIAAMLLVNHTMGSSEDVQSQLNLGRRVGFDLSLSLIWQVWWQFTGLGYYDHHAISHWVLALWPIVLVVAVLLYPTWRQRVSTYLSRTVVMLTLSVWVAFMVMIVLATAMFGDKFHFAGLERYYIPVRPIYFLLFVAPLMLVRLRSLRWGACVILFVCCLWTIQQDWQRTYVRWVQADRVASPYGAWSRSFEPKSDFLFNHLRRVADDELILISNFHEYLAMETSLPTLPIPDSRESLDRWVKKIVAARSIDNPHVLFVLDPNNQWRDYWIPKESDIVATFALGPKPITIDGCGAKMYRYTADSPS